jgi:hypothetical protein
MVFASGTQFIYGSSNTPPQQLSNPNSPFGIHNVRGALGVLDFTQPLTPPAPSPSPAPAAASTVATAPSPTTTSNPVTASTSTTTRAPTSTPTPTVESKSFLTIPAGADYATVVKIHAYGMIFGLLLCPIAGIFVARFMKEGSLWLRIHILIMSLAVFTAFLALSLIVLFKSSPHFVVGPDTNPHHFIGASILGLLFVQIAMGICAHRYYKGKTTPWDRIHWHLGRFIFLCIIANIYFGVRWTESIFSLPLDIIITAGVVLAIGFACFVYGEITFGYTGREDAIPVMEISKPDRYY